MSDLHPLDLREIGLAIRRVVPPVEVDAGAREVLRAAQLPVPTDAYTHDGTARFAGLDPDRTRAEHLIRDLERAGFRITRDR